MKVGDLVKFKNVSWEDWGIILEVDKPQQWVEVYWLATGYSYSFFAGDLEIVNEGR